MTTTPRHDAERKHVALRRIASLYGQHQDTRSALVAVHAAIWSDLYAAHAADPNFDETRVHAAAAEDAAGDTYEGYGAAEWQGLWRYLIHSALDPAAAETWLTTVGEVVPVAAAPQPSPEGLEGNPFGAPGETREEGVARLAGEEKELTRRLFTDAARGETSAAERDSEVADSAAFQRFLLERSAARGDDENVQAEILWALADAAQSAATGKSSPGGRALILRRRAAQVWALPAEDQQTMLDRFPTNPLLQPPAATNPRPL